MANKGMNNTGGVTTPVQEEFDFCGEPSKDAKLVMNTTNIVVCQSLERTSKQESNHLNNGDFDKRDLVHEEFLSIQYALQCYPHLFQDQILGNPFGFEENDFYLKNIYRLSLYCNNIASPYPAAIAMMLHNHTLNQITIPNQLNYSQYIDPSRLFPEIIFNIIKDNRIFPFIPLEERERLISFLTSRGNASYAT